MEDSEKTKDMLIKIGLSESEAAAIAGQVDKLSEDLKQFKIEHKPCKKCGRLLYLWPDLTEFCDTCAESAAKPIYRNILVDGHTGKRLEWEVVYA